MDINSLDRFIEAQRGVYDLALSEIKRERKRSHWMWFIFPQLRSLGKSRMSYLYGIADLDEARAYLAHPILGERLVNICETLLHIENKTAVEIFGEVDAVKLRSSMTLFSLIGGEASVFNKVIEKFYGGEGDRIAFKLLKSEKNS